MDPGLGDLDFCYLSTAGRVTGRVHRIEIWYALADRTLYLLAGSRSSDWVRNLLAQPAVTVELGDQRFPAIARIVRDATEDAQARQLVYEKYRTRYRGDLTDWRDRSLPVAIDLVG
ncbi:MAG: nitroreductase family deazaflavin-dependent oxidoreductase [Egibacteraceae bacterium]